MIYIVSSTLKNKTDETIYICLSKHHMEFFFFFFAIVEFGLYTGGLNIYVRDCHIRDNQSNQKSWPMLTLDLPHLAMSQYLYSSLPFWLKEVKFDVHFAYSAVLDIMQPLLLAHSPMFTCTIVVYTYNYHTWLLLINSSVKLLRGGQNYMLCIT